MRSRSLYIIAIGFGILVTLIGILGFGAVRRAKTIYREMERTQNAYLRAEASRRDIAADMYLADILLRDYLLDPSPQNTKEHRAQLLAIRASLQERTDRLSEEIGPNDQALQRLKEEVQGYWESLDPIFDWTTKDKGEQSWRFLRHNVLPRRQAVVNLAREFAKANRENLEREQQRIRDSQQQLRRFLLRMMTFAFSLGFVVAVITTYRVSILEREHERQRLHILEAEDNLRRLSRRLVEAQESERRSLSRELHDEVGQTLTALGMELANVEGAGRAGTERLHERIEEARRLNADAIGAIRGLAMGLRPSMLDDLGLEPALQWQGREFSRHTGVPATVQVNGNIDRLEDVQRTCVYRVVQEALTNCARHARASTVTVRVEEQGDRLEIWVQDDGTGIAKESAGVRQGLGLIGMRERVEALGGNLFIGSKDGKGTTLTASIPLEPQEEGVWKRRAYS